MQIKKRSLPVYILLNCLTLGVYGFIVSCQVGKEVDALCRGDGERPKLTYAGAIMIRAIAPLVGITVGLIAALAGSSGFGYYSRFIPGEYTAILVFTYMFAYGLIFTAVGSLLSGIYLKYWWYKQAGRLKLNGYRYGLTIKESGVDNFLFRTVMEILFVPITVILLLASCAMPMFIIWLITLAETIGAYVFACILMFTFSVPLMLFGSELSTGAYFATGIMFKNLNRYANVYRNGAQPFELMGYSYYPSVENKYPNFLPGLINGQGMAVAKDDHQKGEIDIDTSFVTPHGMLIGLNGSCAGYKFELTSGEEIVIGKDAKVSSVVIDPAFKEISRKHVSVCYDVIRDQYFVVDYSSNGTWANGSKLITGQGVYLPRGTELKLANEKNTFRLG